MSSLMTSPNSSAPESAWSENQVKKLSGSSCCRFLPALLGVWLDRLVRSCKRRKDPNSEVFNRWTEFRHRANNSFILFLVSIWSLLTSRLGLHFHSGEFLWRGLCSQNTCFHRNTKMRRKREGELWKPKSFKPWKSICTTYKIYSVARFDVFKLCHFYSGQIVKRLLILLPKKSGD